MHKHHKIVLYAVIGWVLCAPANLAAQGCQYCRPCPQNEEWRQLGDDFVSSISIDEGDDPPLAVCYVVESCTAIGEECRTGFSRAVEAVLELRGSDRDMAVVALLERYPELARFIPSRRVVLLSSQCAPEKPTYLIPVSAAAENKVVQVLHRHHRGT